MVKPDLYQACDLNPILESLPGGFFKLLNVEVAVGPEYTADFSVQRTVLFFDEFQVAPFQIILSAYVGNGGGYPKYFTAETYFEGILNLLNECR